MKNNSTQNNTPAENAKPAKKQWQKPDFYILDRNEDINNGANQGVQEGFKTTIGNTNGKGTNYHS